MMNLKKLFASVASVMILASTLPTTVLGATKDWGELQGAYDYAYGIGITTKSSIDQANMLGTLKRVDMAKMMVNYAKEVLDKTVDTSKVCAFNDVAKESSDMQDYMVQACQLGLMGVDANGDANASFNPQGLVTRAQFGTVLSRALYGNANEGGTPYYAAHLQALKDASPSIMTDISKPNATEIRGYVMLMMMRADTNANNTDICKTEENILNCGLGLSSCPSQCQTSVETNGTLNVSLKSSEGGDIPNSISSLQVATYKFTADEDVRLDSVVLKRLGYFNHANVQNVALFINGGRISKVASFSSTTDEATVTIANGYEIKAGETVNIAVHVAVGNVSGDQFSLKILSVGSTAKDVNLASNLTSETFKTLATANPTITLASGNSVEAPKSGETAADLFEFTLDVPTSPALNDFATLKSITFKENGGTIDEGTELENFKLLVDGDAIATAKKMTGKYLIFNVADGYEIKEGRKPTFTVQADIVGGASDTVMFTFENNMDLVVMGDKYEQTTQVAGAGDAQKSVTVSAGKITLNRINPTSTDLLGNKNNIFLGAFEIVNNAGENLKLSTLGLNMTGNVNVLDTVKVRLGSASASPIELTSSAGGTLWKETSIEKNIGSKLTVYVYADTIDTGMDSKTLRMSLTANSVSTLLVEETSNDNDVTDLSPSSLTWTQMAGKDASLTLTNVVLGDKTVAEGTENVDALKFKIKAGTAYGVKLKKITLTASGTVDSDTVTSAKLLKGTTEVEAKVNNGTIVIDEDMTIAAGATQEFTLQIEAANNPETSVFNYYLSGANIEAEDVSEDKDSVTIGGRINGRVITITAAGTVETDFETTADLNKYNKNILAGETKTVAEYSLYSKYEKINVKKAVVTFAGDTYVDNSVLDVELVYNGKTVASNPTWTSNGQVATFADISDFKTETAKAPLLVKVISKVVNEDGGATLTATYVANILLDEMKGEDSGDDIADANITPDSKTFDIIPVTIVPSVATIGSTATDLTVTASVGNNEKTDGTVAKATLTGITFTVEGNNGALTKLTVKDDTNTVLGSGTVTGDGDVLIALSKEASNGATTLKVVTTVSGSINNPAYGVSVKSIGYYTNVDGATVGLTSQFGAAKSILNR